MSRGNILNRIRKITNKSNRADAHGLARLRIKNHPQNVVPGRGKIDKTQRLLLFSNEARRVAATVSHIQSSDLVPNEVATYLKNQNLPSIIKYAPILGNLPWSSTLLKGTGGSADETDVVGVTHAFAGVAETGTVVVCSGPESPILLNYLPITNIVVIEAEKILGTYEDVWNYIRRTNFSGDKKPGFMPRALSMITGPSRTADIEQTLLLGIHGPKRLHIIIVDHAFT